MYSTSFTERDFATGRCSGRNPRAPAPGGFLHFCLSFRETEVPTLRGCVIRRRTMPALFLEAHRVASQSSSWTAAGRVLWLITAAIDQFPAAILRGALRLSFGILIHPTAHAQCDRAQADESGSSGVRDGRAAFLRLLRDPFAWDASPVSRMSWRVTSRWPSLPLSLAYAVVKAPAMDFELIFRRTWCTSRDRGNRGHLSAGGGPL